MDGATQIPISEIEASTTQEFVSCTFRSVNSKAAYFISANNCSRSHINFGQTGGDLSFGVPYPFQRHWPHGVFHQKMRRSRNLQFLCSLFLSFGFFLTSTCPPLKHHQNLGVLPKQQKTQSGTQAKLICEFKRTSLKKPSVLKKLPARDMQTFQYSGDLWGTVHLKVWRTFSQDGDSASHYETQTMHFGYLIICLSITQNCPQWYLNNILSDWLWAKTSTREDWCKARCII